MQCKNDSGNEIKIKEREQHAQTLVMVQGHQIIGGVGLLVNRNHVCQQHTETRQYFRCNHHAKDSNKKKKMVTKEINALQI